MFVSISVSYRVLVEYPNGTQYTCEEAARPNEHAQNEKRGWWKEPCFLVYGDTEGPKKKIQIAKERNQSLIPLDLDDKKTRGRS